MKIARAIGLWLPVGAFMLLILVFSGGTSLPLAEQVWDKLLHAGGYGVFGVLCLRALHGGLRRLRVVPTVAALILVLSYGAMLEWYQAHIPGREASLGDWVADGVGAAVACLVAAAIGSWRTRRGPAGSQEPVKGVE